MMRSARIFAWMVAVCLPCAPSGSADVNDLGNGVFITHHPPELEFTDPPPAEGWCQLYIDDCAIDCCTEQRTRIEETGGAVWFVLSAWDEEKAFCGVEFGFGDYDPLIFSFTDWDPCCRATGCLELSTDNWPGPGEGTAFTGISPGDDWFGNFVPVYWFAGYAYGVGEIPLGMDPATDFAGWGSCPYPPQIFDATCLGAMGILTGGQECCPDGGPSPRRDGFALPSTVYRKASMRPSERMVRRPLAT